jgi:hypothetical protein|tara:strand:+ start:7768 stop:7953 length:186 start_codon:yes stop_codon:yes gene_type:complete
MKLSNQAIGALLMTLQKCLAEEADITELLADWDLHVENDEVHVTNPPVFKSTPSPPKFEIE